MFVYPVALLRTETYANISLYKGNPTLICLLAHNVRVYNVNYTLNLYNIYLNETCTRNVVQSRTDSCPK